MKSRATLRRGGCTQGPGGGDAGAGAWLLPGRLLAASGWDCPAGSLSASATRPAGLFVAALGMLEETSQAGSPCCNPAVLPHTAGPMEQGVYGVIPSPAALRAGAGEAVERLGAWRCFPATLAASGIAVPPVAAVDALAISVLAGPGCRSERSSSSKNSAWCEGRKRGRGKV